MIPRICPKCGDSIPAAHYWIVQEYGCGLCGDCMDAFADWCGDGNQATDWWLCDDGNLA